MRSCFLRNLMNLNSLYSKRKTRSHSNLFNTIFSWFFKQRNYPILFFCFALDPPNITYISANMTVNQSDSVNLTCRADGNPKPAITWSKDGKIRNRSFTVSGKSDEGLHVCNASNGIGNASIKSVFITVKCKFKCEVSVAISQTNANYNLGQNCWENCVLGEHFLNIVAVPVLLSLPCPESNVGVYSKESLIPGRF